MSIRGIDSQMMITRSTEFLQDANSQLKGAERMQDFIAVQRQSEADRNQVSVSKAEGASEAELHLENEGGDGSEAYMSQKGEGEPEEKVAERDPLLDTVVGPADRHFLDVTL